MEMDSNVAIDLLADLHAYTTSFFAPYGTTLHCLRAKQTPICTQIYPYISPCGPQAKILGLFFQQLLFIHHLTSSLCVLKKWILLDQQFITRVKVIIVAVVQYLHKFFLRINIRIAFITGTMNRDIKLI